jgi:phage-related protein
MIRESESEFKAAAAGMDDWRESEEGLTAKIKSLNSITDVQKKKVGALQAEYDRMIADGLDPASKAAVELRTKINNETAALNKNEAELTKQKQALKDLADESKKTGDAADDMGGKFEGLKAAGSVAAGAIAAVGAACVSAVGAFFGLAESTREARKLMGQLETSFETAGHSAEAAEETFTELYGIMGDEGAATEAAQQLAKFSTTEKDLATNTRILTGVMAEYGNSIPTEGLAEGMAATAAMGEVQGVLADALEWQGVNLEEYNAQLATLATEEERAAYIQSTLTDLYGASADAYRENNAEVIAAQKAQAELNDAMNELGAIAEPIMTSLKTLAADLLKEIMPFVKLMGEGLAGALDGTAGSADKLADGLNGLIETALQKIVDLAPFVIETALAIIPTLLTNLLAQLPNILKTLIEMVAQVATSLGKMLPTLIPVVISTVVQLVETLLDNIDLLIDAGLELLLGLADGLIMAIPDLLAKIPVIINKVITAITANLPKLLAAGIELVVKLGMGLVAAIPQLVANIPMIISAIIGGLVNGISKISEIGGDIIRGLWEGISDMAGWIGKKLEGFGESVLGGIKSFFGIHSPSKVMADEVGKNLALGIGQGFEKNIAGVNKQITGAMNFDGGVGVVGAVGARAGGGVVVYQTNNYSQAHSRIELYKTKQATAAAVRLAMTGA